MENITNLYETLEKSIVNYTGLSAATFFTILAIAVTLYYLISGWLEPPTPSRKRGEAVVLETPPPPVQLGEITEEELRAYDGTDPKKPLLMAIKGQIYDVTRGRSFYGPGGPYSLFAGRDASRALAKLSFEEKDLTGDISGLGPFELDALRDWEFQFMGKYEKVGTIKKTVPVTFTDAASETTSESDVKTENREYVETAAADVKTEDKEHVETESVAKTEDKEQVEKKEEEEAGTSDDKKE